MNIELLHIGLYKGHFQYTIYIENGKQRSKILIISPKNNIRFQLENFKRNYPRMAKEKIWKHDDRHRLWYAYVDQIKWLIVLRIL